MEAAIRRWGRCSSAKGVGCETNRRRYRICLKGYLQLSSDFCLSKRFATSHLTSFSGRKNRNDPDRSLLFKFWQLYNNLYNLILKICSDTRKNHLLCKQGQLPWHLLICVPTREKQNILTQSARTYVRALAFCVVGTNI